MIPWTAETNLAAMLIYRQQVAAQGKLTNMAMPMVMYDKWMLDIPSDIQTKVAATTKHKYQYDVRHYADRFMQKHVDPREI